MLTLHTPLSLLKVFKVRRNLLAYMLHLFYQQGAKTTGSKKIIDFL